MPGSARPEPNHRIDQAQNSEKRSASPSPLTEDQELWIRRSLQLPLRFALLYLPGLRSRKRELYGSLLELPGSPNWTDELARATCQTQFGIDGSDGNEPEALAPTDRQNAALREKVLLCERVPGAEFGDPGVVFSTKGCASTKATSVAQRAIRGCPMKYPLRVGYNARPLSGGTVAWARCCGLALAIAGGIPGSQC